MAARRAVAIRVTSSSPRRGAPAAWLAQDPEGINGHGRVLNDVDRDGATSSAAAEPAQTDARRLRAAAAIAAGVTLAIIVLPALRFAYQSPAAHLAIDTGAGVIGVLATLMTFERFRRTASRSDLLLVAALAVFAATNLLLSVVPALVETHAEPRSAWALLGGRLTATALFAAAAFARPRPLRAPRAAAGRMFAACACALALMVLVATVLAPALPAPIARQLSPESSGHPLVVGHPALLAAQVLAMALFAAAGAGFAHRARREHDELMWWLALGAIFAAFARLNYFLFPSLYTDFVYTGDFFRIAFYLALFLGAAREIWAYHDQLADLAVLDERRRMARDLHDGLAQDLAFIVSQSRAIVRQEVSLAVLHHLAGAAERALEESRAAIAALTSPLDEPLATTLRRAAEHVAERHGARVRMSVQRDVDLAPAMRQGLARIVREATSNAVRHGNAREVAVSLSSGSELRLRVVDDGSGFDPKAPTPSAGGGFGLVSMRERAEALGGELRVTSRPGAGAEIEAVIPWAGG
jgi:signal transduction histidine kinase